MSNIKLASKITVGGSWCYLDQLDGTDLIKEEQLLIEWPDETQEVVEIKLDVTYETYMDHGHEGTMRVAKAYLVRGIHGLPVKVYLAGLPAQRVGPKKISQPE